jgi:hypothetical protein
MTGLPDDLEWLRVAEEAFNCDAPDEADARLRPATAPTLGAAPRTCRRRGA